MPAQINLTSIAFAGNIPPSAPMTGVIIRHRLTSDPDVIGSYITDRTDAVINTDGTFAGAPIVIGGLLYGVSYTVWIIPPCAPGTKAVFVTPAPGCVDVTAITGTVSSS